MSPSWTISRQNRASLQRVPTFYVDQHQGAERRVGNAALPSRPSAGSSKKNGQWVVPSQTGNGSYRVNLEPATRSSPMCTCPDFEERGPALQARLRRPVRHRAGEPTATARRRSRRPSRSPSRRCAQRPTYKQDWPAYNAAQINEKRQVPSACSPTSAGASPSRPARRGSGRSPLPMARSRCSPPLQGLLDRLGPAVHRPTCRTPATRAIYRTAAALQHRVSTYLEDPALTADPPGAHRGERLPLKVGRSRFRRGLVRVHARPGSSAGSTTSTASRCRNTIGSRCHVMTGVKTNIVTAVEIDERYAGDCPQFAPLVKATAETLHDPRSLGRRRLFAATRTTSWSRRRRDAVHRVQGQRQRPKGGGVYAKMFHYYSLHRDEFLAHYHKRSTSRRRSP